MALIAQRLCPMCYAKLVKDIHDPWECERCGWNTRHADRDRRLKMEGADDRNA